MQLKPCQKGASTAVTKASSTTRVHQQHGADFLAFSAISPDLQLKGVAAEVLEDTIRTYLDEVSSLVEREWRCGALGPFRHAGEIANASLVFYGFSVYPLARPSPL
jgi:hypothetical protein